MLTRGSSVFTPVFSSRLAPVFARYVDLKRALGRRFDLPCRTLQSLDRFLHDQSTKYPDLNAAGFQAWGHTHEHVTSGFGGFVCWRFVASACIVAGPNRSASSRTSAHFPHIINALNRTFFPRPTWRVCSARLPA